MFGLCCCVLLLAGQQALAQYGDAEGAGDFGEALAVDLNSVHEHGEGAEDEQQRLESLLHWSISNSNPQALHEAAVEATKREAVKDMLEQRKRVRELLDYMNQQPTETDLLKEAIGLVGNASQADSVRLHALRAMQVCARHVACGQPCSVRSPLDADASARRMPVPSCHRNAHIRPVATSGVPCSPW